MTGRILGALIVLAGLANAPAQASDDTVVLFAAGSLKAALGAVAEAFADEYGTPVEARFGPSGLMRERIEGGEAAGLFASASMKHPLALRAAGRGGPVALFARNRLCAIVQPEVETTTDTLLDTLLDPEIRLGTSTPKADPSGDYAWALFDKAEALVPGAADVLKAKALKLTGGRNSAAAPEGRNTYGWVMEEGKADVFLTYCTNARLAKAEVPALGIVDIAEALAVGAEYGLIVLDGAPPGASRLALFILSPEGQRILDGFGFSVGAIPADAMSKGG
ncbi:molybdate ABC transporter substrate-binding protein [Kaustia mangrovi]|uniref:Molybdate ABC transporter substrate-binding protein n=1 Tax=Kaustia mangrovi TaxID=2593653 RepID=A0A7S8C5E2_9HYPH|nr:molybdate ABC transporter substrate-binding protein [Kaustia mangrovi]QPC43721.1 molybdate ABC transporter substrate-binding protein [Kaustia mangrovi]